MNLGFSNIKPLTLAEEVLDSPSMFSVSKPPVLFIVGFSEIDYLIIWTLVIFYQRWKQCFLTETIVFSFFGFWLGSSAFVSFEFIISAVLVIKHLKSAIVLTMFSVLFSFPTARLLSKFLPSSFVGFETFCGSKGMKTKALLTKS